MKTKLIILLGVVVSLCSCLGSRQCEYNIYYKEYDLLVNYKKQEQKKIRLKETHVYSIDTLKSLSIKLLGCLGKSKVELINLSSGLKEAKGRYASNPELVTNTVQIIDTQTGYYYDYSVDVLPTMDGKWTFYDSLGNVVKREYWQKGKLIRSKSE